MNFIRFTKINCRFILLQTKFCFESTGLPCAKLCSKSNKINDKVNDNVNENQHYYSRILKKLSKLEDHTRYHGYSTIRIAAGISLALGIGLYIFRDSIRHNVANEVSSVASKSLEHETVIIRAQELAVILINAILTDNDVHKQAVIFLQEVFEREDTKQILYQLVNDIIQNQYLQSQLIVMLRQVFAILFADPEFQSILANNIKSLLKEPVTQQAFLELVIYALNYPETIETAKNLLLTVINSSEVKDEAALLGKSVVDNVVNDNEVQKHTGDALWSAAMYSITPGWWRNNSEEHKEDNVDDNE